MSNSNLVSVSQLNQYIKKMFDATNVFQNIRVEGEISNFKKHAASGHLYFSLKDSSASISCVMYRSSAENLNFTLENGQAVIVQGAVSCYPKTGVYQILVKRMFEVGIGDLHIQYEKLKEKMMVEGVFKTEENKKALPRFPKKIGIVTSATGAVIRDMIRVLKRRWPMIEVLLVPATVQGENGAHSICKALQVLYQKKDIDLIIVGRGGGSLEDLWNFNEETVVRMITKSPVPIISAVGHETDTTLSDYAADVRAGTPSMAAELAVPDRDMLMKNIIDLRINSYRQIKGILTHKRNHLQGYIATGYLFDALKILGEYYMMADQRYNDLESSMQEYINNKTTQFQKYIISLDALSPLKILERGFSYCEKDGSPITSIGQLAPEDILELQFSDGGVETKVISILEREKKNEY